MRERMTRREALGRLGTAGAGLAMSGSPIVRLGSQGRPILVDGQPVEIVVSSVSDVTVRLSVLPLGAGGPSTVPDDGSLVRNELAPLARRRDSEAFPSLVAGDLRIRLTDGPPTLHVETPSGELVQRLGFDSEGMTFSLGNGPLLGLGQGGPQFDRRGSFDRMKSGQGGYQLHTHGGRVPVQWLVGTEGFGLFVHQPLGTFDFRGEKGRFQPFDALLPLDVFVTGSKAPEVLLGEYARLTGHPELPPLWSFGYMQSHRTLAGREEVLSVARRFREKRLPCDALIYLGTGFTPSGWNAQNGSFAWNRNNFPDPEAVLDELHRLHFRVVLHAVILARDLRGTVNDPCELERYDEEEVGCYWNVHRKDFAMGADGWWPDEGDRLDAKARLTRNRMYWEGPQLDRPNERPFALHRNGYAGMQRYGAFLWSGDVYTTWETLATHVPVAINTGLSGIPYWGTDIGGFVPTKEYTGELHVRWFQFGAFCPLFRAHGRTWHLRLPWGWNQGELGPDELTSTNYRDGAANPDPSELHNSAVEPILKKYLELRYRMLPYLYTVARQAYDTGLPMMRALWIHYPGDPRAVARGDEFLFGRDLLVAPVVEPGASSRRLYLPEGRWVDFWSEESLDGGREVERGVDLETMPLYVRAGAVLPFGPVKQYSDEPVEGPLSLVVYPGADGRFELYEDDGKTFDYREGASTRIELTWDDPARTLRARLAPGSRLLSPAKRAIEARIAGEDGRFRFTFDGSPAEWRLS